MFAFIKLLFNYKVPKLNYFDFKTNLKVPSGFSWNSFTTLVNVMSEELFFKEFDFTLNFSLCTSVHSRLIITQMPKEALVFF